jgi:hypothetical protein
VRSPGPPLPVPPYAAVAEARLPTDGKQHDLGSTLSGAVDDVGSLPPSDLPSNLLP